MECRTKTRIGQRNPSGGTSPSKLTTISNMSSIAALQMNTFQVVVCIIVVARCVVFSAGCVVKIVGWAVKVDGCVPIVAVAVAFLILLLLVLFL